MNLKRVTQSDFFVPSMQLVALIVCIVVVVGELFFWGTTAEVVQRPYDADDRVRMKAWGVTNEFYYQARIEHGWLHWMDIEEAEFDRQRYATPQEARQAITNFFLLPRERVIQTYKAKDFKQ